ncbi:MAG: hypothetical protein JWQ96_3157 [Segetibacter sp.]|nr:hypothetical protein [Segetibacter sp.]
MGETVRGNGHLQSEQRTVGSATNFDVQDPIEVFISTGESSVRVEADVNLLPYIITEVNDNELEIKLRDHVNVFPSNPIKVYISSTAVSSLNLTGSGDITTESMLSSNSEMGFKITGSGNIKATVNAPEVHATITGSGNLTIDGETQNITVSITGSGNFSGDQLKAENATAKVTGNGEASVFADANLKAHILGSGNIKYRGNANVVRRVTGSGSVVRLN